MSSTNGRTGPRAPHLALTAMYERKNGRGTYLVGRVANLKLLIVATDEFSHGDRVWQCFITEGKYSPPASAMAIAKSIDDQP
jgi:hypothetical protein